MTQKDDQGRLCGLMKIEDSNHKFNEEGTRYFVLDLKEGKLKFYFDLPEVVENFTLVLCCTAFVLSHLCHYKVNYINLENVTNIVIIIRQCHIQT